MEIARLNSVALPGCVDPLGSQRFGRKSLSHCASALVEIEGPRSRREEDQLQDVAGRFKIQNSGVVRARLIGIVFRAHRRNCIGRRPM